MIHTLVIIVICLVIINLFLCLPDLKTAELIPLDRSHKKGLPVLGAIVLIYSIVAFYNLGDIKGIESFCIFDKEKTVTVELSSPVDYCNFTLYSGLGTGNYHPEISLDGEIFTPIEDIPQEYTDIFTWHSAEIVGEEFKYIKLSADTGLWLGEIMLTGIDGNKIEISCPEGKELYDEQELVPTAFTYKNGTYFDEIYYARTAVQHINGLPPYEITHPPLGKILIAASVKLLGINPFAWRLPGVLCGIFMLVALYFLLEKMFGGVFVPACGTIILATDFMHFAQTRIATIDSEAVLFILLMYLFMYLYTTEEKNIWIILCGLSFGLGISTKWNCMYAGAGLAFIWLVHWIEKWRREGFKIYAFLENVFLCLGVFIFVPAVIYYLSYIPYGVARGMVFPRDLFSVQYGELVLSNQSYMFGYHSNLVATHPYSSSWWQWIFDIRPILYYLNYNSDGTKECIASFNNPLLCWAGIASVVVLVYFAFWKKEKTARFILIAYFSQLLPWIPVSRLTFAYHYFASSVFLCLAISYVIHIVHTDRRLILNDGIICGFVAVSVILFVMFYPVLSGKTVSTEYADNYLSWFSTWPV